MLFYFVCVCVLHMDPQLFQRHLLREIAISSLICFCTFVNIELTMLVWIYFWTLWSSSHFVDMSVEWIKKVEYQRTDVLNYGAQVSRLLRVP